MDETRICRLTKTVEDNKKYVIRMSEKLPTLTPSKKAAEQRQIDRCEAYTSLLEDLIAALKSGIVEDIRRVDENVESFVKVMQTAMILGA